jgi:hypothetical protein
MQILEIWNNIFTKGLQIRSSFLSYLFLIFCEFQKNQTKFDAHLYKFDKI